MGAVDFYQVSKGTSAKDAFRKAVEEAEYECGHGGYSGSIAEKGSFTMITVPENVKPWSYAEQLIFEGDPRVDDKWGPAGCIDLGDGKYLFFGIASS